ncbi:MAG TPA: type II secretion system protein [Candidatus Paceibacterota bacterium]
MKKGFTLIEMLVSIALFSVVMVMALGALLSLSVADRKAEALKSAVDNLNFALDSMSRVIRTGSGYHCGSVLGGDCPGGSNEFVFTANTGVQTYYRLESSVTDSLANAQTSCGQTAISAPMCGQATAAAGCLERSTDGINWAAITGPNVVIQDFSANGGYPFYVFGSAVGSADNRQPIVIMTIGGYTQVSASQQGCFHVQSAVTQRIYDQ